MKSIAIRMLGLLATAALAMVGLASPGNAVVANPEIRLVTPVVNADNSYDGGEMAAGWVKNGWFHEGITFRQTWAPVGSKIIFTYYVTDSATKLPLVGQAVTLRVNKAWSVSNALVTVNGSAVTSGVEKSNGTDQLRVSAKTDSFGYVTFVMQDTLDATIAGEPQPESFKDRGHDYDINSGGDPMVSYYTQVFPEIMGEKNDIADMTEIHFYRPDASTPDLSTTTARVHVPAMSDTTTIHRTDLEKMFSVDNTWYAVGVGMYQRYAPAGGTSNVVYNVTDASGAPLRNHAVSMSAGKAYSKSNANVTDGTTPVDLAATESADQALWSGTTDGFGNVLYTVTSTDKTGFAKPASMLDPVPTSGDKYSQFWLNVTDSAKQVGDIFEYHFYTAVVPKVAQRTPVLSAKIVKVGKALKVGLKSNRGIAIKWTATPSSVCKISGMYIKGLKVGTCKVTAANAGNSTSLALKATYTVKVTK